MLLSAVQQTESTLCVHNSLFITRALNRVSCAIRRLLLVIYFIPSSVYIREGNGTPLQYSCLENPMGRGTWWAAVHGVTRSRTQLSNFAFTFHFHALEKEMATHSSGWILARFLLKLENPRDGGAWWAAVYGVAQSWT